MPEFFLFCEADGRCVLKQEGDDATRDFSDVLEAITFLRELNGGRKATLTVYDPTGRVTFQDLL